MSAVLKSADRAQGDEGLIELTEAQKKAARQEIAEEILSGETIQTHDIACALDSLFDPETFRPLFLNLLKAYTVDDLREAKGAIKDELERMTAQYLVGLDDLVAERAMRNLEEEREEMA